MIAVNSILPENTMSPLRVLMAGTVLLLMAVAAHAQEGTQSTPTDLAEYEGLYRYHDDGTLLIVAHEGQLVAVIGEAKYPLRHAYDGVFLNGSGDTIPFLRGADGRVAAFRERGISFARLDSTVPDSTQLLFEPRPRGPDGRLAAYVYQVPERLDDGLAVAPASRANLPRDVVERIVNGVVNGTYAEVHSVLVHRGGALVMEEYFYQYRRERMHQMRSLTKSVVALAVGAAADRGLVDPDAPALTQLGLGAFANPDLRKAQVTLLDLLSHRSGLACNDRDGASPGNEVTVFESADWMRNFVDLPMVTDPGTEAHYCSVGIIAAGRVVERAAGMPLRAFADEAIFTPLGVRASDWRWDFKLDRSGRDEYGQMYLRPRDMLKLGLLIKQRGEWQGRRVIPAEWIDAAIARQTRIDDSDYGLGIWHRYYNVPTPDGYRRVDTIMLSGNGGQKVYLVPEFDLVVVFTGGAYNAESPANRIMVDAILPGVMR